jgi:hypothetical protein
MDQEIVIFISGAVAAGAAAMWKGFFNEPGKAAYNKLKSLLSRDSVIEENMARLETELSRSSYQLSIKEDIERLSLYANPDIEDAAAAVIAAAQPHANEIAAVSAIDINQLNAEFIEIRRLRTDATTAVKLHNSTIKHGVTITDVESTSESNGSKKSRRFPVSPHFDHRIIHRRHKSYHTADCKAA